MRSILLATALPIAKGSDSVLGALRVTNFRLHSNVSVPRAVTRASLYASITFITFITSIAFLWSLE
jgi:hypothetical protein